MPIYEFIVDGDQLIFRLRSSPFTFILLLLIALVSGYVGQRIDVMLILMIPCLLLFFSAFFQQERVVDFKDKSLNIYSKFLFINWDLKIRHEQIDNIVLARSFEEGVTIFRLHLYTKLGTYCLNEYFGSKTESNADYQYKLVKQYLDL